MGNFTEELPPTTTVPLSTSMSGLTKEILVRSDGNSSLLASVDGQVWVIMICCDKEYNPQCNSLIMAQVTGHVSTSSSVEVYGTQGRRHNDDEIIGIVIGILATLILLLFILMVIIIIRQKRAKFLNQRTAKVRPYYL